MNHPSSHQLSPRKLFGIAAEHFADCDFDDDTLDAIWTGLEAEAMTSAQLAEHLDGELADLDAFLDWSAEQGLVGSARLHGDTYYARYDASLEEIAERLEQSERWTRDEMPFSVLHPVFIGACAAVGVAIGVNRWVGGLANFSLLRLADFLTTVAGVVGVGVSCAWLLSLVLTSVLNFARAAMPASSKPDDENGT